MAFSGRHAAQLSRLGAVRALACSLFWPLLLSALHASPLLGQVPAKIAPQKSKGRITLEKAKDARIGKPILAGQNVRGDLKPWDPALPVDQTPYQVWLYSGKAGEVITVLMRSTRLDPYVIVLRQGPEGLETVGEDDDGLGAGTADAGLRLRLPADGEYLILANASSALGPRYFYGPYNLELASSLPSSGIPNWGELYPGGGGPNEKYAVVVGISDYPGDDEDLIGPRQDAELFRQALILQCGFNPEHIITLTDRNASRNQIINAFRRFLSQAGPGGTAVFYFSGNGTQLEEKGVPGGGGDERDGDDEALYVWSNGSEEKGSVILGDELSSLASELAAGRVLIVLDASFSGIGSRGEAVSGAPKLARMRDLRGWLELPTAYLDTRGLKPELPAGQIRLMASGTKEVAWTSLGWPERGGLASIFTYFLVDAMTKAAPGTTIEELMAGVRGRTNSFSKTTFGRTQTPQAEGTRIGDSLTGFFGP